jgi:glutathione S-transferase
MRSSNARRYSIDALSRHSVAFAMTDFPILWTFRRCPYAMRARLAILCSGVNVELREILLRDKPAAFLSTSPTATVPTLRYGTQVFDESLDIMVWALKQADPQRLLDMPDEGWSLIETSDGPFKTALDHTKYAVRYPTLDAEIERDKAASFLMSLDQRLSSQKALFGDRLTISDYAILPFVRQFANIDRDWFDAQPWPNLSAWLTDFTQSDRFARIMAKCTPWSEGDLVILFGAETMPNQ